MVLSTDVRLHSSVLSIDKLSLKGIGLYCDCLNARKFYVI